MADMFGAPIGIGAAERDQQQVVQGGLNAMKTLGEIEAQPGQMALQKAHTRYYDANALKAEKEAAELAAFSDLAKGVQGAEGTTGTPSDPASRLDAIANEAIKRGFVTRGSAVAKTAAELRQKQASEAALRASEEVRGIRAAQLRAQFISGVANGALQANTQEGYDAARMQALNAGLPASQLPESYEEAKPLLQQLVTQGLKATELMRAKEQELTGRARRGALDAQRRTADARIGLIGARTAIARRDLAEQTKNGGRYSDAAQESRKTLDEYRKMRMAAFDRKEFPPIVPEADWANNVGKNFTWPGGKKVRIELNPTTKKPEAVLLDVPARPSFAPAGVAAPEDDEDDDLED